jgi:hypothetical protein
LASSTEPIDRDAAMRIGRLLGGTEARAIADRLADGYTLTAALKVVPIGRREEIRTLLEAPAAGTDGRGWIIALLRAVEGARAVTTALDPVWTMPGHLSRSGPLTSSVARLVDGARQSVTCSTFNFQTTSSLWLALARAAERPEIEVRLYLDADAADRDRRPGTPGTAQIAAHLRGAIVLRTKAFDGVTVRNHAKLLVVDHRFLLVTSANFSWSAEHGNVEFGVVIDNPNLADRVERELRRVENLLYEPVPDHRRSSARDLRLREPPRDSGGRLERP